MAGAAWLQEHEVSSHTASVARKHNPLAPLYLAQIPNLWLGASHIQEGPSYLSPGEKLPHNGHAPMFVYAVVLHPVKLICSINHQY